MFSPAHPCPHCNGNGETNETARREDRHVIIHTPCSHCGGTGYILGEGQLRTIVIVGSGDIELGAKLAAAYGSYGLIAPFVNGQYAYGYLHMTTTPAKELLLVRGVEFIPVDEAIKELI